MDTSEAGKQSIEAGAIMENIVLKRALADNDINTFLNSLNESEFSFYTNADKMTQDYIGTIATKLKSTKNQTEHNNKNQNEKQDLLNNSNLMETGRDDTFYSWSLNKDAFKIKEDYESVEKKEEGAAEKAKLEEELQNYLDVMKEK